MPRASLLVVLLAISNQAWGAPPGGTRLYTESARPSRVAARLTSQSFVRLSERLRPTVVGVEVRQGGRRGVPGTRSSDAPAIGTGFIIHRDGLIVTNHHVVARADEIRVRLADGRSFVARVVGSDPRTDVALIQIEGAGRLPVAPLGDSDELRPGELVIAIGHPFGLHHSLSMGIVSAKGRRGSDVRLPASQGGYFAFIQTDAAINRGNSGGPLINLRGEVVGINTAMLGSRGGRAPGIGFSIPINMAKRLLPLLHQHGYVPRSWIGINIQRVTPALAQAFGLRQATGALINEVVPGSPAAQGGLRSGDVVVDFDGRPVPRAEDLRWLASVAGRDRPVPATVWRGGRRLSLSVRPVPHPSAPGAPPRQRPPRVTSQSPLGIEVAEVSARVARRLGICPVAGIMVSRYEARAPAVEAGLLKYDRVLQVGDQKVRTLDDYARLVRATNQGQMLRFLVARYPAPRRADCATKATYLWVAFPRR